MDASEDYQSQQQKVQAALVAVNRTVNSITREDLTFQRTIDPGIASQLDENAARLLRITNNLLSSAAAATGRKEAATLEDADDVELNWQSVVEVIDALLEKADTSLDEYTGMLKRKDAPTGEAGPELKKPKSTTDRLDWSIRRANVPKPQDMFEHKPDNFDPGPWKPILTTKPHATVTLTDSLTTFVDENGATQYKHPYETEITQMHFPEAVYVKAAPIMYQPAETTSARWVDTFEGVLEMLDELRQADVIAVDLEHHDYRTYAGLLSLMQISTRENDWVVDTLQPWRHRLEILNEVFADPRKIKVFHGATSDVVWLQRDLGLYIVGLFDTYFACDCLDYAARSLAYLLKKFADFDADKKYQMADWRIRPLPEEMLYYARSDTHYLLYVYDMVRNELVDKSDRTSADKSRNLIEYVLQKSKETSLLRHEALLCDEETGQGSRGWFNNLVRSYAALSSEQFAVYKAIFQWRDQLARKLDESPGYILPIRSLGDIARVVPPDRKAMWSLLNNAAPVTKASMDELFLLIQQAKARGAHGPSSAQFLRSDAAGAAVKAFAKGAISTMGAAANTVTATKSTRHNNKLPDLCEVRTPVTQLWGAHLPSNKRKDFDDNMVAGPHIDAPWFSFVQAAVTAGIFGAGTPTSYKQHAEDDYIEFSHSAGTPVAPKQIELVTPAAPPMAVPAVAEAKTIRVGNADESEASEPAEPAEESVSGDEAFTLKGKRSTKAKATKASKTVKPAKGEKDKAGRGDDSSDVIQTQTSDSDGGAPVSDDFVPFNYDTAGSVLNAKPGGPKPGGIREKVFDPYRAKTMAEGPKGARAMHFEKTGKTATFKK